MWGKAGTRQTVYSLVACALALFGLSHRQAVPDGVPPSQATITEVLKSQAFHDALVDALKRAAPTDGKVVIPQEDINTAVAAALADKVVESAMKNAVTSADVQKGAAVGVKNEDVKEGTKQGAVAAIKPADVQTGVTAGIKTEDVKEGANKVRSRRSSRLTCRRGWPAPSKGPT